METQLTLFLLGPFQAERAGQSLKNFKSNKARALLAYLAVEADVPHHRDVLAALLWPDSPNSTALALLRDVLSNVRHLLGDRSAETPIIQVEANTLQINSSALWLDVRTFADLAEDAASEDVLERAASLYRGDFLEGFALADSPEFEAWAMLRRETFRRMMLDTLYQLATLQLQRGEYASAQVSAQRQLTLDCYSEESHRQLLRALALAGQRNQALAHYAEYRALLEEALGVEPDIRTTALYQRIRDRQVRPNTQPKPLWEATGLADSDTLPVTFATFAGREAEMDMLETLLQQVQRGAGQVVFVTGEAGSGKTTLVHVFMRRVLARARDIVVAVGTCNAQVSEGDPYLPFREIVQLLVGDFDVPGVDGTIAPEYAQQLEKFAPTAVQALVEEGPDLVGRLVPESPNVKALFESVPGAGSMRALRRAPQSPAALCDQVTRVLRAVAKGGVLVLVVDDLHWADNSTLNLLAHLGRRLMGSRILLIGVYRPTDLAPDAALLSVVHELQRVHSNVTLDLDIAGGRAFVDAFLDSAPNRLGEAFRTQLTVQTGGHALFTVSLVHQMQDEGTLVLDDEGHWVMDEALDWSRLPPRVEAIVAEQLMRLPNVVQALLAVASVEGEVFTAEVVARVLGRDVAWVRRELHDLGGTTLSASQYNLVHALRLDRVGDGQRVARYRFRHALFQQYLYAQLGAVRRMELHEAVGRVLETLHAPCLDEVAVRLAYHFEAAGLYEEAIIYLTQAGERAYQLSAPGEAIRLYQKGLTLLSHLVDAKTRARLELALQVNMDAPLLVTQGWGTPERAQVLERAYALAQQLGDTDRLLTILYTLADLSTALAEHHRALAYAEQLLSLARQAGDHVYEVLGYRMTGTTHFFLGHYLEARAHLEKGLTCYSAIVQQATSSDVTSALGRAVFLRAWLPQVLFVLGYPDQAKVSSREALACVRPNGPAFAQAMMLTIAVVAFHATVRRPHVLLCYVEDLLLLVEEHNLGAFQGWATFYQGWARVALGQTQVGLIDMATGWEYLQSTGTRGSLAPLLTLWAEAYVQNGEREKGQMTLNQAFALVEQTNERSYLAEMHRVRGLLRLKEDVEEDAEACFTRAIEVAQEQVAKLWELRATIALARLWAARGRITDAHDRLLHVYEWFTEGLDTPDLMAAQALLESLTAA